MRQHLQQGDVALAMPGEFGNVVGDCVVKSERALLHQHPHGRRSHHFGVRIKQPQCFVAGEHGRGFEPSLAEAPEHGESAVTRKRDLRPGIAFFRDVALDHPAKPIEGVTIEACLCWVDRIEHKRHRLPPAFASSPTLPRERRRIKTLAPWKKTQPACSWARKRSVSSRSRCALSASDRVTSRNCFVAVLLSSAAC